MGAILVALAMAIADAFEAVAAFGAPPVRIEPDQDVVDTTLHFTALAQAADPPLGTFVIGAAFGAN